MRAGWMRAVGDKVLHGDAADLAAHRVEAGDGDALRRVVDDEVGAGELLERADVAALAADDAAFQVVGGDMDGRNGVLGRMVGSDALNGQAQDACAPSCRPRPWCGPRNRG